MKLIAVVFALIWAAGQIAGQSTLTIYVSSGGVAIESAMVQELEIGDIHLTAGDGKAQILFPFGKTSMRLLVFAEGYASIDTLILLQDQRILQIELFRSVSFDEILIRGNAPSKRRSASIIPLSRIKTTPVLFGEADIFRALQTLPGINFSVEGTSDFVVRGGGVGENLVLIDGQPTYASSHLLGLLSPMDAEIVKSVEVYKGGFPARYGGKVSSVIDIKTREFTDMDKELTFRAGVLSNTLHYSDKLGQHVKFILSGRSTLLELLAQGIQALSKSENIQRPFFYDAYGKIAINLGMYGEFSILHNSNRNVFREESESNFFREAWSTPITSAQYAIKKGGTALEAGISSSRYTYINSHDQIESGIRFSTFRYDMDYSTISARIAARQKLANGFVVSGGTLLQSSNYGQRSYLEFATPPRDTLSSKATFWHNHLSLDWEQSWTSSSVGMNILFAPGSNLPILLEPRVYLDYRLRTSKFFSTFSVTHQTDHLIANRSIGGYLKIWLPASVAVPPARSAQYSLGYERDWSRGHFSVEMYYKHRTSLVHPGEGDTYFLRSATIDDLLSNGIGKAYGLELAFDVQLGNNTRIYSAYTLGISRIYFPKLNSGQWFPDYFDRRHSFFSNLVHKTAKGWELNAAFTLNTGQPYTFVEGIYPVPSYNPDFSGISIGGGIPQGVSYAIPRLNNKRLPAHHRLDITLSKKMSIFKIPGFLSFGVYNLYARINPMFVRITSVKTTKPVDGGFIIYQSGLKYELVSYFNFIPFVGLSADIIKSNKN